jgi:hypothetical protein
MSRIRMAKNDRTARWVDESRRRVAKKERAARWVDEQETDGCSDGWICRR